jgi:peptidoglycan/xylan/chitin deacetylase (PgdA/CDA1 family)
MSCAFDLDHYRELLDAAEAGGYRWARFDAEPKPGDLFLRHDVDLSLEAARTMARLERELGAHATYFMLTESVFYNLDSALGRETIAELRDLGHAVGLHAVHPRAARDDRFDAVVAWHNPDPDYVHEPVSGMVNVMQAPWFTKGRYRSDSNQHWREGCPHDELRTGAFEWLQLLVHPEIWVYPGATMGETMRAMAATKHDELLGYLAGDRIDLA